MAWTYHILTIVHLSSSFFISQNVSNCIIQLQLFKGFPGTFMTSMSLTTWLSAHKRPLAFEYERHIHYMSVFATYITPFWAKMEAKPTENHLCIITTAVLEVLFASLLTCVKLQSVTRAVLYDSNNFKPGAVDLEASFFFNVCKTQMIFESDSGGDFQQETTFMKPHVYKPSADFKKCLYWSLTAFRKKNHLDE